MFSVYVKKVKTEVSLFGSKTKSCEGTLVITPKSLKSRRSAKSSQPLRSREERLNKEVLLPPEFSMMIGQQINNQDSVEDPNFDEPSDGEEDLSRSWTVRVGNGPPCKINDFNKKYSNLKGNNKKKSKKAKGAVLRKHKKIFSESVGSSPINNQQTNIDAFEEFLNKKQKQTAFALKIINENDELRSKRGM
jgi:hypothetical protein